MRSLKVYSIILATVLAVFFGVLYWPLAKKHKNESQENLIQKEKEIADFQLAERYFKEGQYAYALDIISRHQESISLESDLGREWLLLLTKLSEKTFDVEQLVLIYDYFKESLDYNEKASLLVAESFLMNGQNEDYQTLREGWRDREGNKDKWALLDADHLLLQGQYLEGSRLLETELKGKDESARLIRLSLLHAMENPDKALDYLAKGREKDPSDPDIFLYETKLLEKLGREKQASEVYREALKSNPHSVFMHDQFAHFFARQGKHQEAINMWKKTLSIPSSNEENLKADSWIALNFFDRVVNGKKHETSPYAFLNSPLKPLISYFSELNQDIFADEEAFSKLERKEEYLEKEQAVYWLFLLDLLSKNEKEKALNLILNTPFKGNSFNSNLEFAFLQTLNLQQTGEKLKVKLVNNPKIEHPLLKNLLKDELLGVQEQALLQSEEAFAALSLAAGFTDAALKLHQLEVIPENFPDWYALELTQVMRQKLGDEAALQFASKQTLQNTQFFHLIQEMSARIALNKGDKELAEKIYESLAESSMEAKSYLARKAFRNQDFQAAEKLTEELLAAYPNNLTLLDNLKKIREKNL